MNMTYNNHRQTYSARRGRGYSYPNEAEPSYYADRLLNGLTAFFSGVGIVTLMMYLLTF